MTPQLLLILLLEISAAAILWQYVTRRRRTRRLEALAREWNMHFSPGDRFKLASRVAERFPVPGAAGVRVLDLVYGMKGERFHYVFTVDYTRGVVRTKKRLRRVAGFSEPRERAGGAELGGELVLADAGLETTAQYRQVAAKVVPGLGNIDPIPATH
jgi:hypothetical protein